MIDQYAGKQIVSPADALPDVSLVRQNDPVIPAGTENHSIPPDVQAPPGSTVGSASPVRSDDGDVIGTREFVTAVFDSKEDLIRAWPNCIASECPVR
jgi:hypothetical protein